MEEQVEYLEEKVKELKGLLEKAYEEGYEDGYAEAVVLILKEGL